MYNKFIFNIKIMLSIKECYTLWYAFNIDQYFYNSVYFLYDLFNFNSTFTYQMKIYKIYKLKFTKK